MGNPTQATELLQRSLELARTAQADYDVAMTLHSLGDVALLRGDGAAATAYYIGSLRPTTEAADRIYCLAGLAAVAALERVCFGAADGVGALRGARSAG